MKPTNEQLNFAVAEALGYRSAGRAGVFAILVLRPGTDQPIAPPDFCGDRNALPELWSILTQLQRVDDFIATLQYLVGQGAPFDYVTAPPRAQVVAFLYIMGFWPKEWEIDKRAAGL